MARKRDPRREQAFDIWKQHNCEMKLKDIAVELGVSDSQIRKWKSQDKWEHSMNGNVTKSKGNVTNKTETVSWVEIENEYVTDIRRKPCTLEDLSKRYKVSISRLEKYAAKNEWSRKRRNYVEKVQKKHIEKSAELISDDLSNVTARHLRISDKLLNVIEEALEDKNEFYKVVEKLRTGYGPGEFSEEIVTETVDALNESKLLNVVNAADKLQKMQRQTFGILDAKDQLKIFGKDDNEEYEDDGFEDALNATTSEVWKDDHSTEEES